MIIRHAKGATQAKRQGFTLIELAIVLAVASLLFAGLWRLMSSGNTQLRDQAAADQQLQLINAVSAYLATTEGQTWLSVYAANATASLPLPTSNSSVTNCKSTLSDTNMKILCEYLPIGFTGSSASSDVRTTNAYGQSYEVRVLKDNQAAGVTPKSYSFMVLSVDGDTIPDTSGGRIASMIGNDGGFVYSTDVCGSGYACGAFGSWAVSPLSSYGFSDVQEGHVASRTYAGIHASQSTPWLARSLVAQSPTVDIVGGTAYDFNTIQVDTYLGLVSSTATIASLSGSAVDGNYGGTIKNLRRLAVGRSSDAATSSTIGADPVLTVNNGGCTLSELTEAGLAACSYAMEVTGSVSISDVLVSNKLFAGQFIYRTEESDKRLKTDITPIADALDKIGKLEGYSFTMKSSGEKKLGVIAQEVREVFPELVHKIDAKYIGVDYIGLIGPLVAAVKELKEEKETLQQKIEAQDKKLEAQDKRFEEIEKKLEKESE